MTGVGLFLHASEGSSSASGGARVGVGVCGSVAECSPAGVAAARCVGDQASSSRGRGRHSAWSTASLAPPLSQSPSLASRSSSQETRARTATRAPLMPKRRAASLGPGTGNAEACPEPSTSGGTTAVASPPAPHRADTVDRDRVWPEAGPATKRQKKDKGKEASDPEAPDPEKRLKSFKKGASTPTRCGPLES